MQAVVSMNPSHRLLHFGRAVREKIDVSLHVPRNFEQAIERNLALLFRLLDLQRNDTAPTLRSDPRQRAVRICLVHPKQVPQFGDEPFRLVGRGLLSRFSLVAVVLPAVPVLPVPPGLTHNNKGKQSGQEQHQAQLEQFGEDLAEVLESR